MYVVTSGQGEGANHHKLNCLQQDVLEFSSNPHNTAVWMYSTTERKTLTNQLRAIYCRFRTLILRVVAWKLIQCTIATHRYSVRACFLKTRLYFPSTGGQIATAFFVGMRVCQLHVKSYWPLHVCYYDLVIDNHCPRSCYEIVTIPH